MVLKASNPAAKFEDTDDGDTPVAAEAAPAPQPATASVTLPAVQATALPSVQRKTINVADFDVLSVLENRLPPVGFGEGVRLVGSNGQLLDGDKKQYGDFVELLLLSWNKRWVVSPGVDGQAGRDAARYSLDGETTTQGENMKEYVEQLRRDGFEKAAIKEYADLFGLLLASGKPCEILGKSVVVALSPDSVKAFSALRRDLVVLGMQGMLPAAIDPNAGLRIKVSTELKSGNGNTWTRLVSSLVQPS